MTIHESRLKLKADRGGRGRWGCIFSLSCSEKLHWKIHNTFNIMGDTEDVSMDGPVTILPWALSGIFSWHTTSAFYIPKHNPGLHISEVTEDKRTRKHSGRVRLQWEILIHRRQIIALYQIIFICSFVILTAWGWFGPRNRIQIQLIHTQTHIHTRGI